METQKEQNPAGRSAASDRKSRARRHRRRTWTACLLAITAIAGTGALAVVYTGSRQSMETLQTQPVIYPDGNAVSGVLNAGEGKPVEEGDYWIVLNQLPTMKAGSQDCNIQFENPKENHYRSRLSLYLKSTGEQIGGTGMVDTGMYVETILLSPILEPGEYPLQAVIELFDGTEPAGEMTLEITLRMTDDSD